MEYNCSKYYISSGESLRSGNIYIFLNEVITFYVVGGDFNQANLRSVLPKCCFQVRGCCSLQTGQK